MELTAYGRHNKQGHITVTRDALASTSTCDIWKSKIRKIKLNLF